jgi:hypothetical protein
MVCQFGVGVGIGIGIGIEKPNAGLPQKAQEAQKAQFVGALNSWEPYQQPRYAREFKPAANCQKVE